MDTVGDPFPDYILEAMAERNRLGRDDLIIVDGEERAAFDAWRSSPDGRRFRVRRALRHAVAEAKSVGVSVDEFVILAAEVYGE